MSNTKIKICGLTTIEDAELMNRYQIDYIGIVLFYEKSKRYCSIEKAKTILKSLNPAIKKVAVTVSPSLEQVKLIEEVGFDFLQVHGELKEEVLENTKIQIYRAFNEDCDSEVFAKYLGNDKIAGFVFDGKISGSGETFDWNLIKQFDYKKKRFILAGGLNSMNVSEAIKEVGPDIVDVSSGVENDSGNGKDEIKIKQFVEQVRGKKDTVLQCR